MVDESAAGNNLTPLFYFIIFFCLYSLNGRALDWRSGCTGSIPVKDIIKDIVLRLTYLIANQIIWVQFSSMSKI